MYKNFKITQIVFVVALSFIFIMSCSSTDTPPNSNNSVDDSTSTEVSDLEKVAKILAQATSNEDVVNAIKEATDKRFDGDTEALYSDISSASLPDGTTLATQMATAYASKLGTQSNGLTTASVLNELQTLSTANPKLQIAVRGNSEDGDLGTNTLVAFEPESEDATQIKAYDSEGNVHLLDASTEPEEPVIVVGLNERTDDSGNVIPQFLEKPDFETASLGDVLPEVGSTDIGEGSTTEPEASSLETQACHHAYTIYMKLKYDSEPWYKGYPEIYMRVKLNGDYRYYNLWWVNKVGVWYGIRRYLGCTFGWTQFYFYEDDSWPDSDDYMGHVWVYKTAFDIYNTFWNVKGLYFYTN